MIPTYILVVLLLFFSATAWKQTVVTSLSRSLVSGVVEEDGNILFYSDQNQFFRYERASKTEQGPFNVTYNGRETPSVAAKRGCASDSPNLYYDSVEDKIITACGNRIFYIALDGYISPILGATVPTGGSNAIDGSFDVATFGSIKDAYWDDTNRQLLVLQGNTFRLVDFVARSVSTVHTTTNSVVAMTKCAGTIYFVTSTSLFKVTGATTSTSLALVTQARSRGVLCVGGTLYVAASNFFKFTPPSTLTAISGTGTTPTDGIGTNGIAVAVQSPKPKSNKIYFLDMAASFRAVRTYDTVSTKWSTLTVYDSVNSYVYNKNLTVDNSVFIGTFDMIEPINDTLLLLHSATTSTFALLNWSTMQVTNYIVSPASVGDTEVVEGYSLSFGASPQMTRMKGDSNIYMMGNLGSFYSKLFKVAPAASTVHITDVAGTGAKYESTNAFYPSTSLKGLCGSLAERKIYVPHDSFLKQVDVTAKTITNLIGAGSSVQTKVTAAQGCAVMDNGSIVIYDNPNIRIYKNSTKMLHPSFLYNAPLSAQIFSVEDTIFALTTSSIMVQYNISGAKPMEAYSTCSKTSCVADSSMADYMVPTSPMVIGVSSKEIVYYISSSKELYSISLTEPPEAPLVLLLNKTTTTATIRIISSPKTWNGKVLLYLKINWFTGLGCDNKTFEYLSASPEIDYTITNMMPSTFYNIEVEAFNSNGASEPGRLFVKTNSDASLCGKYGFAKMSSMLVPDCDSRVTTRVKQLQGVEAYNSSTIQIGTSPATPKTSPRISPTYSPKVSTRYSPAVPKVAQSSNSPTIQVGNSPSHSVTPKISPLKSPTYSPKVSVAARNSPAVSTRAASPKVAQSSNQATKAAPSPLVSPKMSPIVAKTSPHTSAAKPAVTVATSPKTSLPRAASPKASYQPAVVSPQVSSIPKPAVSVHASPAASQQRGVSPHISKQVSPALSPESSAKVLPPVASPSPVKSTPSAHPAVSPSSYPAGSSPHPTPSPRISYPTPAASTCPVGYVGKACEIPICYGIYGNESNVCSGRGTCVFPSLCTCNQGNYGHECQHTLGSFVVASNAEQMSLSVTSSSPSKELNCSQVLVDSMKIGNNARCSYNQTAQELRIMFGESPIDILSGVAVQAYNLMQLLGNTDTTLSVPTVNLAVIDLSIEPKVDLKTQAYLALCADMEASVELDIDPIQISWSSNDSSINALLSNQLKQKTVTVPSAQVAIGYFSITVSVSNKLKTATRTAVLNKLSSDLPELVLSSTYSTVRSNEFVIDPSVLFKTCMDAAQRRKVSFAWSQKSGPQATFSQALRSLVVNPFGFSNYGTYEFLLSVQSDQLVSSFPIRVDVAPQQLTALTSGPKQAYKLASIVFTATTTDPDNESTSSVCKWEIMKNDQPVTIANTIDTTSCSSLTIPSATLTEGSYNATLKFSKASRSASSYSSFEIVVSKIPMVSIEPVSLISGGVSASEKLVLKAVNMVSFVNSRLALKWTCDALALTDFVLLSSRDTSSTLTIKPNVLTPGKTYTFKATVTDSAGSGFTTISIYVNAPPSGGSCSASPTEGTASSDTFELSCTGWQSTIMPLTYTIKYYYQDSNSDVVLVPAQQNSFVAMPLPAGYGMDEKLSLTFTITDKSQASTTVSQTVTVRKPVVTPSQLQSFVEQSANGLIATLSSGDAKAAAAINIVVIQVVASASTNAEASAIMENFFTSTSTSLISTILSNIGDLEARKVETGQQVSSLLEASTRNFNFSEVGVAAVASVMQQLTSIDDYDVWIPLLKISDNLITFSNMNATSYDSVRGIVEYASKGISGEQVVGEVRKSLTYNAFNVTLTRLVYDEISSSGYNSTIMFIQISLARSSLQSSTRDLTIIELNYKKDPFAFSAKDSNITSQVYYVEAASQGQLLTAPIILRFYGPFNIESSLEHVCVAWDSKTTQWKSSGCSTLSVASNLIECACNSGQYYAVATEPASINPPMQPGQVAGLVIGIVIGAIILVVGISLILCLCATLIAKKLKKGNKQPEKQDLEMEEQPYNPNTV